MIMRDWLEPFREWFDRRPAAAEVSHLSAVVRAVEGMGDDVRTWGDEVLATAAGNLDVSTRVGLAAYLAIARELAERSTGMRPFTVQLHAAAAMLRGVSMELDTGEGKTLVGAVAAAGYAISGGPVHVLSANEYLARRDAEWMGPFFSSLGLSYGAVTADSTQEARRRAYAADITYVPVTEAGFDILRDRLVLTPRQRVRRHVPVAILDEADAVLLDEGRVPLVLAAESVTAPEGPTPEVMALASTLREDIHYAVDQDHRSLHVTDEGFLALEEWFPDADLFGADHQLLAETHVALHARVLLVRDVDYVIRDARAWLVSAARGRIEQLQRWPEGLQSAVEAKEGLEPSPGLDVMDQITMADLVKEYDKVIGMSATLMASAAELFDSHELRVARLPPNTASVRVDEPGRLYATPGERNHAAIALLREAHAARQPVLIATQSVADSEEFASAIREAGLESVVLNARNDEREAAIIALAGEPGQITVSTQMAGRGTDIRLAPDSVTVGGLLIIGLGVFPSRRLQDQIRGRSGRQGDPGRTILLSALGDDVIAQAVPDHHAPERVTVEGQVLDPRLCQLPDHAQQVSDGAHQSLRSLTHRYGRLLGLQRRSLLRVRERWLTQDQSVWEVLDKIPDVTTTLLEEVSDFEMIGATRVALLSTVDHLWSHHLAYAADVREGIHLRVLVRENPLDEFNNILALAWPSIVPSSITDALHLISRAKAKDGLLDLDGAGLQRPSATWAYTVTDNSLGTEAERMAKALFKDGRRTGYF